MQKSPRRSSNKRQSGTNSRKRKKAENTRPSGEIAPAEIRALQNVVGSCLGIKKVGGKRTRDLCVTVLVRKKLPHSKLPQKDRIPKSVVHRGKEFPTDVIVVGRLREEFGFAFDDQTQLGTIGAFARRGSAHFGLTCAHCLTGPDGDFNTPDQIRIEFPSRGSFLWLGQSGDALKIAGAGQPGDFGNFDAGLIEVSEPSVLAYAETRPVLPAFRPSASLDPTQLLNLLNFTPVQGWGAKTNNIIRGQIEGVYVTIESEQFDFMVGDPANEEFTRRGDSGLMWTGPYGQAYGMHMQGDGGSGETSAHSFACFAYRIVDRWQLGLLST